SGRVQLLQHLEARELRHFHIEEHEIGADGRGIGEERRAAPVLGNDVDVLLLREERAQPLQRQRLVVDEHRPDGPAVHREEYTGRLAFTNGVMLLAMIVAGSWDEIANNITPLDRKSTRLN